MGAGLAIAWRFAALGGTTAGLMLSPAWPSSGAVPGTPLLLVASAAAATLAAVRPRESRPHLIAWLALLAVASAIAGLGLGALRLAAIDRGAFEGPAGRPASATGFVTAVPRRSGGEVRVRIATADGRVLVVAREPVPELPIGREIAVRGVLRDPTSWERGYLARYGIRQVLAADRLRLTGTRRGGVEALVDRIRDRAEAALRSGTPEAQAELLRGFVLGEDDRIDPATIDDFKRSGLAHLLAVSGENVMLLALLAMPILAVLGVSLRARLACVLVLIAIYVPLTGAGPSIQRAGVMGAAGVIALLAGRPRSRWYAVLLAAFATLAVNPRASGDAGWQLSFAAVVGIMLWTRRLRDALLDARARERDGLGWRRAVAEGAAVTIAATLATAPLMAHHFGALSVASLPANLLALPAVAPVMWLGMLAAAVGQLPWLPVEPLTFLAGLLAAYIAAVAHWLGAPAWARLSVSHPGPIGVIATYAALAAALELLLAAARRRAGLARRAVGAKPVAAALALVLIVVLAASVPPAERLAGAPPGLRITVLDVGQGDAILLDPADGDPVLIDGGPPGDELRSRLESEGVSRLAAAIVTHDQSDHAGGLEDVLGQMPVDALLHGGPVPGLLPDARAAGIRATAIAEGAAVDSGALHLDVLWPPRPLLDVAGHPEDPNRLALVLLARWHGFEMLLTGDAEAEAAPVDPGPIDVLKVAHHGSADVGLDALLGRAAPRLAVISVGSDNPYGHPAPETLSTLSEHGVPTLRTDQDGNVTIDVTRAGWRIDTDGG